MLSEKIKRTGFINPRYRIMEFNEKNYLVDFSNPRRIGSYLGLMGAFESVFHCWELNEGDVTNLKYKKRPYEVIKILGYEYDNPDEKNCVDECESNEAVSEGGLDRYWFLAILIAPVLSSISIITLSGVFRSVFVCLAIVLLTVVMAKLLLTPTIEVSGFKKVRIRHYEKMKKGRTSGRLLSISIQAGFSWYLWFMLFYEFNVIMFIIISFLLTFFTFGKFLMDPPSDHHYELED